MPRAATGETSVRNESRADWPWGVRQSLVCAVGCWLLLSASADAARLPSPLSPKQAAHAIQIAIRHHRAVAFDANVAVEFRRRTGSRHFIAEFTEVPLIYAPKAGKPRDREYFRVVGFTLRKLRVRPIPRESIVAIHRQRWDAAHPRVSVLTHRGIVRTDNAGHVPAVRVHLGNGKLLEVPVGLTGINED